MDFNDIEAGMSYEISRSFSVKDVENFSALSGDTNPIHLNQEYAAKTIFKKPIVHGFLYSSLTSSILANHLPGPGTIYKKQELKFLKPVYHDELITCRVEVIQVFPEKNDVLLKTEIYNRNNETIVSGEALVKKIDLDE